jgi:TonB family protein
MTDGGFIGAKTERMGNMRSGICTPARVLLVVHLVCGCLTLQISTAHAQLVPSVSGASAPASDSMERAQRQADNVMRWIKVHVDKPRAATPAPAPAPAKSVPAKPPAPTAAQVPEPRAVEAAAPPPAEVPVAAPVAAPTPVIPVVAPPPPPPAPVEEEEAPLQAIAQPQPSIPRSVLSALTSGKVMVRFTVELSGKTSNVEIVSSSNRKLNSPTVAAVSDWRFQPIKTTRTAQVEFDFLPQ